MNKLLTILLILSPITAFANVDLENNEALNTKIHAIQKTVAKQGEGYKSTVLAQLEKYKKQYENDPMNKEIAEYTISKIGELRIQYGVTVTASPLLYIPEYQKTFYGTGTGPTLDEYERVDAVETTLFSGAPLIIEKTLKDGNNTIYQVQTSEYPFEDNYYIDARFVRLAETLPRERNIELPTKEEIIANLKAQVGQDYIWGGDMPSGVPELEKYYTPLTTLDSKMHNKLILKGFDCSGLLYYATNGYTPRNTSKLIQLGDAISIAKLSPDEIIKKLQPLDIIGWKGHIMIVIDSENLIESRLDYNTETPELEGGVRIRKIKDVLEDVIKTRIGVDDYSQVVPEGMKKFVIRRWYGIEKQ